MKPQKLFIHTIGCQMNVYDSERIIRSLEPCGYRHTEQLEEAAMKGSTPDRDGKVPCRAMM